MIESGNRVGIGAELHLYAGVACGAAPSPVQIEAMRIGVQLHRHADLRGSRENRRQIDRIRLTRQQQSTGRMSDEEFERKNRLNKDVTWDEYLYVKANCKSCLYVGAETGVVRTRDAAR